MLQIAVLVDAGYVLTGGGLFLTGRKLPRQSLLLDVDFVLADLRRRAVEACPGGRLLRIYWYDGVRRNGTTTIEQDYLAGARDAKLRLGMVNSAGEQKGVDSLIVIDMIELARNRAVTDLLLVSGDEDIRVGMQLAQSFGVRVHLLGIGPPTASQSPDLVKEADTREEWSREDVGRFLKIGTSETTAALPAPAPVGKQTAGRPATSAATGASSHESAERAVVEAMKHLTEVQLGELRAFIASGRPGLPPVIDRPALAIAREMFGRDLELAERNQFRAELRARLQASINDAG